MPPPFRILFLDEGPVGQLGAGPRAVARQGVLAVDLPAGVLAAKHVEAEAGHLPHLVLLHGAEHPGAAIAHEACLPPILRLGDDGGDPRPAPRALAQVLHGPLVLRAILPANRHGIREVAQDDAVGALVVVDQPLPMPTADRQGLMAIGIHDRDCAHRQMTPRFARSLIWSGPKPNLPRMPSLSCASSGADFRMGSRFGPCETGWPRMVRSPSAGEWTGCAIWRCCTCGSANVSSIR